MHSSQPALPSGFLGNQFRVQDGGFRTLHAPILDPDSGGARRPAPGGGVVPIRADKNAIAGEGERIRFSLLMSTYQGDDPEHCRQALQSICDNSVLPDDLVLVLDGPAPEPLIAAIASFSHRLPLRLVHLSENRGLGEALAVGLEHCRYNWVARFDADDICMPDRFERQLAFIAENPHVDAFSSPVEEFRESPGETNRLLKSVPCGSHALAVYARRRNPLNHMAVMFRKDRVLAAGNYQGDACFEDYALWVRLLQQGACLDNMAESTVWVRAGRSMVMRRGGWRYARAEYDVQRKFLTSGFIGFPEFIRNLAVRIPVRLLSVGLRTGIYAICLRRTVR